MAGWRISAETTQGINGREWSWTLLEKIYPASRHPHLRNATGAPRRSPARVEHSRASMCFRIELDRASAITSLTGALDAPRRRPRRGDSQNAVAI